MRPLAPVGSGNFWWDGKLYSGTHVPLISNERFQEVQAVFQGRNKPRHTTREFAYRGLLTCAYDNCKVTAEVKKERYIYYHCTGFRGNAACRTSAKMSLEIALVGSSRTFIFPILSLPSCRNPC